MNVKKLALSGVSIVAGAALFLPTTGVGAVSQSALKPLIKESNAVLDVQTELNCNSHAVEAVVKNKSAGTVTPQFTFDEHKVDTYNMSVDPGKTVRFNLPYTGNDYTANIEVAVDAQPPMVLTPAIHCIEPISFKVMQTSDSAITGYLSNNSSFVGQTVFTRVNGVQKQVETLGAGETRLVAIPFEKLPTIGIADGAPNNASLVLGTADGFQSSYLIDLNRIPLPPMPPAKPVG